MTRRAEQWWLLLSLQATCCAPWGVQEWDLFHGAARRATTLSCAPPEHFWFIHLWFRAEALTWVDPVTVCGSEKAISGGATVRSNRSSIPWLQQSRGMARHGQEERSHLVPQASSWGDPASWQAFPKLRTSPLHTGHQEPMSSLCPACCHPRSPASAL